MTLAPTGHPEGDGEHGSNATAPPAQPPPARLPPAPAPPAAPVIRGRMARPALLGATLLGTLSNNILNVPLRDITRTFHTPLSSGILVVTSFVLVLAAALPVTGSVAAGPWSGR